MTITQFTMEEVRCFADRQRFEIRPLTFLVGENSTGKTTALACLQVLANYLKTDSLDFNVAPYSMGIFRDIVRRSKRPEKSFSLGLTFEYKAEKVECTLEFVEKAGGFEPAVRSVTLGFADGEIVFKTDDRVQNLLEIVWADEERNQYRIGVEPGYFEWHMQLSGPLGKLFQGTDFFDRYREGRTVCEDSLRDYVFQKYRGVLSGRNYEWDFMWGIDMVSTSPIRSQPKRTYDLTVEYNAPEGSDVPMRLMRIEAMEKDDWKTLKGQLDQFGKSSGLFQSIDIKNLGRSMGTPFQLAVKVRGPSSNIVDVGYGVSQILPILVQAMSSPLSRWRIDDRSGIVHFLLQQPEVHLHPKAQAELSSLLARLASLGSQSFVVETHSDYMIDRARIEIMKGNISKEDVSLIYLEPKRNVVKVHNISFDNMGNMLGTPPNFRDFFLRESSRLLGFEE